MKHTLSVVSNDNCYFGVFVVVLEGRAAIQQLQSIAEEFEKGKLDIATTADVQVAGVEGECRFINQVH